MKKEISIKNLLNSNNPLIINFLEQDKTIENIKEYKKNPSNELSQEIIKHLKDYFTYVLLLNNLKRNVYFKSQHLSVRAFNDKNTVYIPGELIDLNVSPNEYRYQKEWDDIINSAELLDAINKLSIKYQRILWLLFVDRLSQKDVSKMFLVSQQSISKDKRKLLKRLKLNIKTKKGNN